MRVKQDAEEAVSSFDEAMEGFKASMNEADRALYHAFSREYDLAAQIIGLRKSLNLTQQQLAVRANLNQSEISRLERGVANPVKSTLDAVAGALGAKLTLVPA
ncbi:MAG: helix-turn-helix domain-containing protein [Candidatus Dormibacteria bacterium]